MCGLTGFLDLLGGDPDRARATVGAMAARLAHRGPDGDGVWFDDGLAFGHTRLAIIDPSEAGCQPMQSACQRYVLVFNGEIYNHMDLRGALQSEGEAPAWRGHSDTETLLEAIARWGPEFALKRAEGMFALALWDRRERALMLARDRLGEKPLYYGWAGRVFLFGSELKALRAHPEFQAEVDRGALAQFLRFTYVPAPRSIWRGIFKLEPGCILRIDASRPVMPQEEPLRPGQAADGVALWRYWSLADIVETGSANPLRDSAEALDLLEATLSAAVRRQMVADVPLGAFLSGGVDSSAILALMQKESLRPVRSFTVGFEKAEYDEAPYAQAVARHLGTDHTEVRVTETETQGVIPRLPHLYDEPFADSSQIPVFLVSQAARAHVTVALSGDGGDELFGGYYRYFLLPQVWNRFRLMPFPLRRAAGRVLKAIPITTLDAMGPVFNRFVPYTGGVIRLGDKMHRLGERLVRVRSVDDLYFALLSEWEDPAALVVPANGPLVEPVGLLHDPLPPTGLEDPSARMMYRDTLTYLPDDILCKVDRAAMGVSLETRVPFLDPQVVELAWRLPMDMRIRGSTSKWALRQILLRHVPARLIERPKAGFGIPVGDWLRGPLKPWAEDLIAPERLEREGFLRSEPIHRTWREHQSGRRDWTPRLWSVLMFQAWLEANR
jgi:asparagine synthase (glutamine-hydrolysing)